MCSATDGSDVCKRANPFLLMSLLRAGKPLAAAVSQRCFLCWRSNDRNVTIGQVSCERVWALHTFAWEWTSRSIRVICRKWSVKERGENSQKLANTDTLSMCTHTVHPSSEACHIAQVLDTCFEFIYALKILSFMSVIFWLVIIMLVLPECSCHTHRLTTFKFTSSVAGHLMHGLVHYLLMTSSHIYTGVQVRWYCCWWFELFF